MATAFAQQLRQIAAHSTNELDLKARRNAHAESLLFERDIAIKQDWDTLFQLCLGGFQELCTLDARFREFESNLFSAASRHQDRDQMSKAQNEDLDVTLGRCLHMLGPRLGLRPGLRALEWLVRRFRVHIHNVGALLLTVLRFHESQLFQNVLSLVSPNKLIDEWKFLRPFHNSNTKLPRHAIVYAVTNNQGFFSAFNEYTLQACRTQLSEPQLMRFWGGIIIEAVAGRLSRAKSGRAEVQQQRTEDELHQVLPILSEGLNTNLCVDLTMTCFSLAMVLTATGALSNEVIDSLLEAVSRAASFPGVSEKATLITLALLAQHKPDIGVPRRVAKVISQLPDIAKSFGVISTQHSCQRLFLGVILILLKSATKRGNDEKFTTIRHLMQASMSFQTSEETAGLFALVVNELQRLEPKDPAQNVIRAKIINLMQEFSELETCKEIFHKLVSTAGQQGIDVEAILQVSIPSESAAELRDEDDVEMAESEPTSGFEAVVAAIPAELPADVNFFVQTEVPIFRSLRSVLLLCYKDQSKLNTFKSLALWRAAGSQHYVAFLLRILFSDGPNYLRNDAASLLSASIEINSFQNPEALLSYFSVLLADKVMGVRRTAAAAIASLQGSERVEKQEQEVLTAATNNLLSSKPGAMEKVLSQLYLPNMEEFIADETHIRRVLKHGLNGTVDRVLQSANDGGMILSKSIRAALMEDFARSAAQASFLRFKLGMIEILDGVTKAGSVAKTEVLLPILKHWASMTPAEATSCASAEELSLASIDKTIASIVTGQEKHSVTLVLEFLQTEQSSIREQFLNAMFDRIVDIWPDLLRQKDEALALRLFNVSLGEQSFLADVAKASLMQITLSDFTLQTILENAISQQSESQDQPPRKKRRTSSHGAGRSVAPLTVMLRQSLPRLTLALDLVEGSRPEQHPALLPQLTEVLLHLRRTRDHLQAESPYLVSSCLGSMIAIIDKLKSVRRPSVDWSNVRADIIADCVRNSESTQVQLQALKLSASLAEIAPDKIIHHIMPVFTFMGKSKIMAQSNQHSVNVVNEAIDRIVPPLVATLRKQDPAKVLTSSKHLLSSFTASFNHIPEPRKVPLFQRLLRQLGPEDFGFVAIAMLVHQQITEDRLNVFLAKVFAELPVRAHLSTYRNLIILAQDCFAQTPHNAEILLELSTTSSAEQREDAAVKLLIRAQAIIKSDNLRTRASNAVKLNSPDSMQIENQFRGCLLQTLDTTQALLYRGGDVVNILRQSLVELLRQVSAKQMIQLLVIIFDESSEVATDVQAQALHSLTQKLGQKGSTETDTSIAALDYLARLEAIISDTESPGVKVAAIECVDRICTKFGRRDVNKLLGIANLLTGDVGLASLHENVQIVAAHTLSSMIVMMREAAVPVVSQSLRGALKLIENSHASGNENPALHNASFSLIMALTQGIGFMLSEDDISDIILAAAECAFSGLPSDCALFRTEALKSLALQIDMDLLSESLTKSWEKIAVFEKEGIMTAMTVLAQAIDHHPKTIILQAADKVSSLLLKIFDLRRYHSAETVEFEVDADDLDDIEAKTNEIALKFIYKLNDGVFRPIFETWVDWATKPRDLSDDDGPVSTQKILRQTTLGKFLAYFFSTLKSIVTSYATFLIKPANESLSDFHKHQPTQPEALSLYTALHGALSEVFTNDADGFFTAPSHFEPLARNLVQQLELAANKNFRSLVFQSVLPAIVALATAVQDSPSHHLAINHYLAQLRHADSHHVRLASIRTHLALTEDEEVGEEWVNNVVSGTVNTDMLRSGGDEDDESGGYAGVGGSGETMIYVNEMLEDDDEEVEREVRRWVRMVREKVGEDVFET